jgi:uncharacterized RmlC-like cupin family protein
LANCCDRHVARRGRAKTHKHEKHETAIYVLWSLGAVYYGENLEKRMIARDGEFVYVTANTPHLSYNMSDIGPCTAIITRTDPNEQESVMMLPELAALGRLDR